MRNPGALAAGLLALLFLQGLVFITESSQTSDEGAHLAAGYSYLTRADFRLNPEHPPLIKELAALPLLPLGLDFPEGALWEQSEEWNIGRIFVHENRLPNDTLLFLARLPVLFLSLLLGWAMYHWGRKLFGAAGALLGLALYVLDPNVVAHSGLVTTDLGIALFVFLAVYAFWCWSGTHSRGALVSFGLSVGGAFAAKYTAVWLPPILAALGAVLLLIPDPRPRAARLLALLRAAGIVVAIAFVVLALTYAVVGLPAYLVGLQRTLQHSAEGHRAYLMGAISETGWWHYFLVAWLIKTPPGTLLLVGASLAALALRRRRSLKDEMFIYLPVLVTLAITSLFRVNIGLRHILPIYPFLYMGVGRLLSTMAPRDGARAEQTSTTQRAEAVRAVAIDRGPRASRWVVVSAGLALLWNGVEAARIAPYHLAYFNLLVGGPSHGHEYLLDSNLDWGQSARALKRYMATEGLPVIYCAFSGNTDPFYYGVAYQYAPGSGNLRASKLRPTRMPPTIRRELFAVSAMVYHSLQFSDPRLYSWLWDHKPIAMPGYSFLVFDITGDADSHAMLGALCYNFKLWDLADFEARRALRYDPQHAMAHALLERLAATAAEPDPGGPPGP